MKRFYFLLSTLLFSVLWGNSAFAYDVEVDGIYYNFVKANVAEVTSGDNKYIGEITIPSSITYKNVQYSVNSIGKKAYYECKGLTSVSIPNSITDIKSEAFSGCTSLTYFKGGNFLTKIGYNAFYGCSNLTTFDIPNTVTEIGKYAFCGCKSLTSINIPNNVTKIEESTFAGCSALTSVLIPNSIKEIDKYAFQLCSSLTSITIPNSISTIRESTFEYCQKLTNIIIPNSVETIEKNAFYACLNLSSLKIPDSVKKIEREAFSSCKNMSELYLGNSITDIGMRFVANCDNLKDIYCYALDVPHGGSYENNCSPFEEIDIKQATLYVPAESIDKYKSYWNFFGAYKAIEGSIEDVKQCAIPIISYQDGKLKFTSNTDGAQCYYTLNAPDVITEETAAESNNVSLSAYYDITCYAKADGYTKSETAKAKLYWLASSGSIEGDNIEAVSQRGIVIQSSGGFIGISGLNNNESVSFYSIDGKTLGSSTAIDGTLSFAAKPGAIVIAKIGNESIKVYVE